MATSPQFVAIPNSIPIQITVANIASDGGGTLHVLVIAAATGTRVDAVTFRNGQSGTGASSAMLGKLFLSDTSNANARLVGEVLIPGATRSATVLGASATFTFSPALVMRFGQRLSATKSIQAGISPHPDDTAVIAFAGDF